MNKVLLKNNLYKILSISNQPRWLSDVLMYLLRSKACHPECAACAQIRYQCWPPHFSANFWTTLSHAGVPKGVGGMCSVNPRQSAYTIQGGRPPHTISYFKPASHARDIFRSVVIGVFNDFLDGNLEMIRTLLCELCLQRIQYVNTVINATVH